MDMQAGDNLTLSTLHATVHLGAHADAPSHYGVDAETIDRMSLERYLGRCTLLRVDGVQGRRIRPDDIPAPIETERVLLATGTFPDPERFREDFAALSPELIERFHGEGVRLVGIDTPAFCGIFIILACKLVSRIDRIGNARRNQAVTDPVCGTIQLMEQFIFLMNFL